MFLAVCVKDYPKSDPVSLGFFDLPVFRLLIFLLYLFLFPQSLLCYNKIRVEKASNHPKRSLSFAFFTPCFSDPCFCCVTDDFNYLLTPCAQQIHMINGPGDCCTHHLDGAKESVELSSTVILKTAPTAGGGLQVYRGNEKPSQFRSSWQLFSVKRVRSIFLSETAGSLDMLLEKETHFTTVGREIAVHDWLTKLQHFIWRFCWRRRKMCEAAVGTHWKKSPSR